MAEIGRLRLLDFSSVVIAITIALSAWGANRKTAVTPGLVGSTSKRVALPGLTFWNFSCVYDSSAGRVTEATNLAVLGALIRFREALQSCAPTGSVFEVVLKPDGQISVVKRIRSNRPKANACVTKFFTGGLFGPGIRRCAFTVGFGAGSRLRKAIKQLIGRRPTPPTFNPIRTSARPQLRPWFARFVGIMKKQNYAGLPDPFARAPRQLKRGSNQRHNPTTKRGNFAARLATLKRRLSKTFGARKAEELLLYLAYILRPPERLQPIVQGLKFAQSSEKDRFRMIQWNVYSAMRVWLQPLEIRQGVLTIRGTSAGLSSLTEFVARLQGGPFINSLSVRNVVAAGYPNGIVQFELTATIGPRGWL